MEQDKEPDLPLIELREFVKFIKKGSNCDNVFDCLVQKLKRILVDKSEFELHLIHSASMDKVCALESQFKQFAERFEDTNLKVEGLNSYHKELELEIDNCKNTCKSRE